MFMPFGSPISFGQGMVSWGRIQCIVERISIPMADAGIRIPPDAALSIGLRADAVLVDTAVACIENPSLMIIAMKRGVAAGTFAYLADRMPPSTLAQASSAIRDIPVRSAS